MIQVASISEFARCRFTCFLTVRPPGGEFTERVCPSLRGSSGTSKIGRTVYHLHDPIRAGIMMAT
eukprot:13193067-Alexandrium_andersonii.AAC.1